MLIPRDLRIIACNILPKIISKLTKFPMMMMSHVIGLAKLYEARNGGFKKYPTHEDRHSGEEPPPLPSTNLNRTKTPATRRLMPDEMQDRRSQGLCFNCNERFMLGHHCQKLFVIEGIYLEEKDPGEDHDDRQEDTRETLWKSTKIFKFCP